MTRAATSESYDSGTARVRGGNHGVHGVGRRGGPERTDAALPSASTPEEGRS